MTQANYLNIVLQPNFLSSAKGRIFYLFTPPATTNKAVFLFLPSFAEELNRCRVMVAMQARKLAAQGYGFMLLDYYGTGDSEGDFSETTWQLWREDALSAQTWLAGQGYNQIILWGARVGALLAIELGAEHPELFSRLLLWQPVVDGQTFLTQFLRIRMTMLMDRGEPKETTQQMRQFLQQGNPLEIAGYTITPELANELDNKKMSNYQTITSKTDWFEMALNTEGDISPGSKKIIDAWRLNGADIQIHTYNGPAFWQLYERELTPDLLEKTTLLFSQTNN